jgi:hypothetical protein
VWQSGVVPFGQNTVRFFFNLLRNNVFRDTCVNQLFPKLSELAIVL